MSAITCCCPSSMSTVSRGLAITTANWPKNTCSRADPSPGPSSAPAEFFDFAGIVVSWTTIDGVATVASLLIQPVAVADVADLLARTAVGPPRGHAPALVGPETQDLVDMARRTLDARQDGTRLHATGATAPSRQKCPVRFCCRRESPYLLNDVRRMVGTGGTRREDADAGWPLSLLDPDLAHSRAHAYQGCRSPSRSNRHGRGPKDLDGRDPSLRPRCHAAVGIRAASERIPDPSSWTHGSANSAPTTDPHPVSRTIGPRVARANRPIPNRLGHLRDAAGRSSRSSGSLGCRRSAPAKEGKRRFDTLVASWSIA